MTQDNERGRNATTPSEIPGQGWMDIGRRVKEDLGRDNISLIAAGLALYGLLAVFPALAAILSIYGMVVSSEQAASQVESLAGALPQQAADLIRQQLQNLASQQSGALGWGAALGIVLALWSARKGMAALVTATNIAYDENEERGFIKQTLMSFGFTIAAVVGFIIVLLIAVVLPMALEIVGLGSGWQSLAAVLRWLLLWCFMVAGLAFIYHFAPDRAPPQWRWVSWGSAIAAILWVIGSVLFSLYVRNFGSYGETYGALGSVVILLLWFFLSAYIVLLGAEINAEMEHQTRHDTTRGEPRPMGQRGAYVADNLGKTS